MHLGEDLIVLGVLLLVAYVLGRLGRLVGLPAIPIYMLVGLLASPHTGWFPLNFEKQLHRAHRDLRAHPAAVQPGPGVRSGRVLRQLRQADRLRRLLHRHQHGRRAGFGFWVGWGTREALIIAGMTATSSPRSSPSC